MIRNFCAMLVFVALSIAALGMACVSTVNQLDTEDETDGAT
jgi:hypothetical protein